ncbi:MAG: hypothetical protein Q8R67_20530 [Rhodoferax sp.]|nr:hypothetical protein [Rhodoferax sp.]MDP3654065.1 hypothetical protein [Rhodoferax sp.]
MNLAPLSSLANPPARANRPVSVPADASNFGAFLADSLKADISPPNTQATSHPPLAFTARSTAPANGHERVERRSAFTDGLHGLSPKDADQIAKNIAYEDHTTTGGVGPLLDASGFLPGGDGILRYSGSGEPVTAQSQAYFNATEASFRQERMHIYESEKAKGTPPAEIYDKLVNAMDQQPERYRGMMNWSV